MRNLIESLQEHLVPVVQPIGGGLVRGGPDPVACGPAGSGEPAPDTPETSEGDDDDDDIELEEGSVGTAAIQKIVDAAMSPKLAARLATLVKRGGGDDGDLEAAKTSIMAHFRIGIPTALADAGINVQKAQTSKARRAGRAVVQGKSAVEAIEMTDEEFLAALGEELEKAEA